MTIKRFTLQATATALLALNAEATHAATCPLEITDNSLAGQVCEFSANSSVTVKNGGEIGGITMRGYHPGGGSQIVIDAGGLISNTTLTGISVVSSALSNGIINNGTINTGGPAIAVASSSTIAGGITNNGSIATIMGTGIRVVSSSTISGAITNNGIISSGGVDVGIVVGFNSIVTGGISNTGTIHSDDNADGILVALSSTISGNISNSGLITAADSGIAVYVLSRISGDILNSGTIIANAAGIRVSNASTVDGNINNSGYIVAGNLGISIDSQSVINGISNSGTIRAGSTGISVSNTSAINGSISNSGIIQGDNRAIFIDPASSVNQINILGQRARIIGAVEAVNTDVNITSGAVFTSEGTFNVNNFNVAANAIFTMRNGINVQNNFNNAGTVALNTAQTLIGNYVQQAGGVFQTDISGANNYGQLIVTGDADLSQSGNINVSVAGDAVLQDGKVFSNIISAGNLMPPASFNVTDNSFIWQFIASATSTSLNLTAHINPAAYTVCTGEYCQGAANTIIGQIAAGNPVFSMYSLLSSENALRIAASQATPELINENIQVVQSVARSLTNIIPMWNVLHSIYSPINRSSDIWVKPYGTGFTQNALNTVDGFNAGTYGLVAGKDVQLPHHYLFGSALAAGSDNINGKSKLNGQSLSSDSYAAMFYGAKQFAHHIYLAAEELIGYENNQSRRFIPLFLSTASGSFNSWFADFRTQLGWNGDALNHQLIFTPELDASFLYIHQNSFRESGSPMNLAVNSSSLSPVDLGAYGHLAYHVARLNHQADITLTSYAGIACDIANNQSKINAAFIAGGPYFSTFGVAFNQLVFRGGLGLRIANPERPLSVNFNYDVQAGNHAYNNAIAATLVYHYDI